MDQEGALPGTRVEHFRDPGWGPCGAGPLKGAGANDEKEFYLGAVWGRPPEGCRGFGVAAAAAAAAAAMGGGGMRRPSPPHTHVLVRNLRRG